MNEAKSTGSDFRLMELYDRTEWLDTFSMVLIEENFEKLFDEIVNQNSVFMTNGAFAYYLIQRLQSHSPTFRLYEEGIHYYISKFLTVKCYFLAVLTDHFTQDHLNHLNKV